MLRPCAGFRAGAWMTISLHVRIILAQILQDDSRTMTTTRNVLIPGKLVGQMSFNKRARTFSILTANLNEQKDNCVE
jgi:hypothetical protein